MEHVAQGISRWMQKKGELSDEQRDVVEYALMFILSTVVGVAGIVLVSWATGILAPGIFCAAAAATYRLMSGGAHYSSSSLCAVMSIVTFPALASIALLIPATFAPALALAVALFALWAVIRFAPVDNEAKPIREAQRPFFRAASAFLVLVWTTVSLLWLSPNVSLAVSAGIAWQSLSLTPAGSLWYRLIDRSILRQRGDLA